MINDVTKMHQFEILFDNVFFISISEPEFYDELVYIFTENVGSTGFLIH